MVTPTFAVVTQGKNKHWRKNVCACDGGVEMFKKVQPSAVLVTMGCSKVSLFATPGRSDRDRHFRKVRHRYRGRRSTFSGSGKDFVTGAVLSQGLAQNKKN